MCEEYPINPPEGTNKANLDVCKSLKVVQIIPIVSMFQKMTRHHAGN